MAKKIILIIVALLAITLYIMVYHTNLIAQPTYTRSQSMRVNLNGNTMRERNVAIVEGDNLYINIDHLKDSLGLDVSWDENNQVFILYNGKEIIRILPKENTIRINRDPVEWNKDLLLKDGQPFINSHLLSNYTDYSVDFIEDMNITVIDKKGSIEREVSALNRARMRHEKSIWGDVTDIVEPGESLHVYYSDREWSYVRNSRGLTGYIRNIDLSKGKKIEYVTIKPSSLKGVNKKINLTWEYVHRVTPKVENLESVEGLNVISPTWFSVINEKGDIESKATHDYVMWAHQKGYEVWGLFNNSFDPDLTHKIVNDALMREKIINNIVDLATEYNLDGINIDFENVYLEDKEMFTQFIKELTPIAHETNLTLSIDVTIKSLSPNWSMFYDRQELGNLVDYVILMAYDEYWAGAGASGSVASIPWVRYGVETLLEEVVNHKIVLGVPFYTRIWKEQQVDGELKVNSYAVSMSRAEELIEENKGTIIWDEKSNQYYGEYRRDGAVYKVWLEDRRSMKERLNIIEAYNLAGIASWRRGFEKEEIWGVIKNALFDEE